MLITSEQDINGESAKYLRVESKLNQRNFWGRIGISQSNGCHLEKGDAILKPLRILLFVNYVAGIDLDVTTPEGVARILKLASRQPRAGKKSTATEKDAS